MTSQETERDLEAFSMSGLQLIFSQFRKKNVTTGLSGLEYGITLSFWAEDQKNRTCLENHMKKNGFHCQGRIIVQCATNIRKRLAFLDQCAALQNVFHRISTH